ncbi:hypothetical protein HOY82DRAFT_595392 [Tuber indicum]|nr:hypothetical protein HOY82DRAFT_595392 [Tuber indicum]
MLYSEILSNSQNRNQFSNTSSGFSVTNSSKAKLLIITHKLSTINDGIGDPVTDMATGVVDGPKRCHTYWRRSMGIAEWQVSALGLDDNDRLVGFYLMGLRGLEKSFIWQIYSPSNTETIQGRGQTAEVMIGSLLRSSVIELPQIPQVIVETFHEAKARFGGRAPELAEDIELFPAMLELRSAEKELVVGDGTSVLLLLFDIFQFPTIVTPPQKQARNS